MTREVRELLDSLQGQTPEELLDFEGIEVDPSTGVVRDVLDNVQYASLIEWACAQTGRESTKFHHRADSRD